MYSAHDLRVLQRRSLQIVRVEENSVAWSRIFRVYTNTFGEMATDTLYGHKKLP